MRPLILLLVLVASPRFTAAQALSTKPSSPPGAIQLIEGYRHEPLQGIDSSVGRIWKDGGLEIRYDIGRMAGNYAASIKGPDRVWVISQVVNGQPVEIVKAKDGRVLVTFTKGWANFFAKVSGDEDLAVLLSIVLTYPAAPAAG